MRLIWVTLQLTCTMASLILTTLVTPGPITVVVNFWMDVPTCFFRIQAWGYFILFQSGHFDWFLFGGFAFQVS